MSENTKFEISDEEFSSLSKEDVNKLVDDRNEWQRETEDLRQKLTLTEAALGDVMQANNALVEGQQTLIAMIEKVRPFISNRDTAPMEVRDLRAELDTLVGQFSMVEETPEGLAVVKCPEEKE